MSYISRRLAPGEAILHKGRFHFVQEIWPWVALLVLGILVVGIFIWIAELVRMSTTQMAVTNRRVLMKRGFFMVHLDELTLGSIEGSNINQSIFGRMFGYGKLTLQGRGDTHLQFPTMDQPSRFRSAIEQALMRAETAPVEIAEAEPPLDETRNERKRRLRAGRRERHAH